MWAATSAALRTVGELGPKPTDTSVIQMQGKVKRRQGGGAFQESWQLRGGSFDCASRSLSREKSRGSLA